MSFLSDLLIILILLSIWYIIIIAENLIKKYKQKELFKQQEAIKKQELLKKQELIKQQEAIRKQELLKQQEAIKKQELLKQQQEEEEDNQEIYDEILLLIMVECLNNKNEIINKIINKIIKKYKHTDKLDKYTKYDITDIFNEASINKQIDLVKLVFSLDNIKNKQYLSDNIFIGDEETFDELVIYSIKNNMDDLFEFVFESKSFKIDEDKYIEFEKYIKSKEIFLLFIKHKTADEYHNIVD